ncbi:invasion associated locus B family protein [Maricaulis sp. CAU 1757]
MQSRLFLTALALSASLATPVAAQTQPEFQGEYTDWRVFTRTTDAGRVCYTLSRPTDSTPLAHAHGNVYFLISSWQSGAVEEQPSLLVGYNLRPTSPPQARVGSNRYDMFTDGQEGFLDDLGDEPDLVREMKRGSSMRVTATTADGVATSYEFSLSGVTAALDRVESLCR